MSKKRARLLVELGRETIENVQTEENNNEQIMGFPDKGSPLPLGADFSEEYMELFKSAFEDTFECEKSDVLNSTDVVLKNVVLSEVVPCLPNIITSVHDTQYQSSPMSIGLEPPSETFSDHLVVTPMPSPCSDFGTLDESADTRHEGTNVIICETPDLPEENEEEIIEKVLSSPYGNINVYYYKRKLNVYHFTIYDMASKEAYCYVWDEQTAKRGAYEVASCVYDFCSKIASKGKTEILLWSDNCGGQNRNRIVYLMYIIAARVFNMKITHRFMEKGHTQNEGDSVHALIERTDKSREIYSPSEWVSLIRWAKGNKTPYNVIEVNQDMIYDFKSALTGKNWIKNKNNVKVAWNKVKEISTRPECIELLFYKYSLGDSVNEEIQCLKKPSRRHNNEETLPGKAYQNLLCISKAKFNDLIYFCDKNIIPESYHNFY